MFGLLNSLGNVGRSVFVFSLFLVNFNVKSQEVETLPQWVVEDDAHLLTLSIPTQIKIELPRNKTLKVLVLNLDPAWAPEWKNAAFELKTLIVSLKTLGAGVKVGVNGSPAQIDSLLNHEMDAYFDGYLFKDDPYLPNADQTGKLWQKIQVTETEVLSTLVDAASLGIELVLFENMNLDPEHRRFLKQINNTETGSLDRQPELKNFPQEKALFFYDATSGNYHLAVYAEKGQEQRLWFPLGKDLKVSLLYPDQARFQTRPFGSQTEIELFGESQHYWFLLEPKEKPGTVEGLKITRQKVIDPYELVVLNQVFKDREQQKIKSMEVDELQHLRYSVPNGIEVDIAFLDRVIFRRGKPIERLRKELYLGGVKWPKDKAPELPLIQPEKVQTVPLEVDLDKSYRYRYLGEATINGHPTWRVRFEPKQEGDFFSGTVWIDQETGAHRQLRALQSGLEAPVLANETTAVFDWVTEGDQRYWVQVSEKNLQLITLVGERISLQIDSTRSNFKFNSSEIEDLLQQAYKSNITILRDSTEGFRYLVNKDGKRVESTEKFTRKKAILGGVFFDPGLDSPIPLGGFNYTNLDFLGKGYQANFFLAGAINDLIISNPDFLGKGWDLTAELFATALYFGDSVYGDDLATPETDFEEIDALEVESIRQSFNLSLGIPISNFFKLTFNYGLRYLDFKEADDTQMDFVIPQSTFENAGRLSLEYSRKRFLSEIQYETVSRSDWEAFGLPGDLTAPQDSYRTLRFNAALSKQYPNFQSLSADFRYLKGWDLDRFSRFDFGFFGNGVSGFGSSGIEADEAVRMSFEYEIGISGLYELGFQLDGARAMLNDPQTILNSSQPEEVDLLGFGVSANFLGPWRTLMRLDLGYGIHSDIPSEEGEVNGRIFFLKLF